MTAIYSSILPFLVIFNSWVQLVVKDVVYLEMIGEYLEHCPLSPIGNKPCVSSWGMLFLGKETLREIGIKPCKVIKWG